MTQSFAGSRSLDERRRRRLASESGESASSTTAAEPARKRRSRRGKGADSSRRRRASHFPLRKLISARFWKIWGVGFCVMLAGAGVLAGTWAAAERPELLGPGFARYFEPSSSRAVTYFNTFLLISSAQLAFLIWWVRSRSLQDFSGRYRIWAWTALGGFAGALCLSTGAHTAWSDTVAWLWKVEFPSKQIWFWLAPALLWGGVTLQFLRNEMRECRASLSLLWLSAVCFGGIAAWQFGELPASFMERIPVSRAFLETGLMTLACCLVFQSMLLHARHVIYTSVEPPAKRESRFRLRLPFFGRRTTSADRPARRSSKKKRKAGTRTSSRRRAESVPSDESVKPDTASQQVRASRPQPTGGNSGSVPRPATHSAHLSSGKPHEPAASDTDRIRGAETVRASSDSLRGLSKKERKRLKQLQREERRQQHAV